MVIGSFCCRIQKQKIERHEIHANYIQTLFIILAFSRHKTFFLNIGFFKLFIGIKFPLFQFILIYIVRILFLGQKV